MKSSNFNLLKIVSMFFIVLWHVIVHGNVVNNISNDSLKILVSLISFIICMHVNLFVIITGYFQSKSSFKLKKIIDLTILCYFYKFVILSIFYFLGLYKPTVSSLIIDFFPINLSEYWFIQVYIYLYLFSPFLNKMFEKLNKVDFKKLLLLMFIVFSVIPFITNGYGFSNNGFTLYNFVFLYSIGAYFRKYPLKSDDIKGKLCLVFLVSVLSNFAFYYLSLFIVKRLPSINLFFFSSASFPYYYSNPFVIIQTVSFFLLFSKIKINSFKLSSFINYIAPLSLGVYLIHDNSHIRKMIYVWLKIDNGPIYSRRFIFYMFLCAVVIFVGSLLIEFVRKKLFDFVSFMFKNHIDIVLYGIFGVLTTIINIVSYYFFAHILNYATIPSTIIAWIVSVLFAYVTNRIFVFKSKAFTFKEIVIEITSFFTCRVLTGIFDLVFMYILVDICAFNDMVIKIMVNVIVIVLNYVASKLFIFKK